MVSEYPSQKEKHHAKDHPHGPGEGENTAGECVPPAFGGRSPMDLRDNPTCYVEPNGPPKRRPCYKEQVEIGPCWAVL